MVFSGNLWSTHVWWSLSYILWYDCVSWKFWSNSCATRVPQIHIHRGEVFGQKNQGNSQVCYCLYSSVTIWRNDIVPFHWAPYTNYPRSQALWNTVNLGNWNWHADTNFHRMCKIFSFSDSKAFVGKDGWIVCVLYETVLHTVLLLGVARWDVCLRCWLYFVFKNFSAIYQYCSLWWEEGFFGN